MKRTLVAPGPKPVLVRAIHANAGVHAWYRKKLQDLMRQMYDDIYDELRGVWKDEPPIASMAVDASRKNPSILLRRVLHKWGRNWIKSIDKLSLDLSAKFADKSFRATQQQLKSAFSESGFTVKFKPTRASLASYHAVRAENVGLIRNLPTQFYKRIEQDVWKSVREGASMSKLSLKLQESYGMEYRRAALISRDQNNKAKAVIESTRRQELGITIARWQHSGGGKEPRPEHVAFSGKLFELKKGAFLEGKWVWPGTEINCRCTSSAIIPGLEDEL